MRLRRSFSWTLGIKCSYWQKLVGISLLAQLLECLDTQTEGLWFESLQWRLIYLLHLEPR